MIVWNIFFIFDLVCFVVDLVFLLVLLLEEEVDVFEVLLFFLDVVDEFVWVLVVVGLVVVVVVGVLLGVLEGLGREVCVFFSIVIILDLEVG